MLLYELWIYWRCKFCFDGERKKKLRMMFIIYVNSFFFFFIKNDLILGMGDSEKYYLYSINNEYTKI